jgi:hypothetical protein
VKSRVSREVHARSEASELIEVSGEIPLAYSTMCSAFIVLIRHYTMFLNGLPINPLVVHT